MAEGRYAEACPKLAESHRLDPGAGALTALALCHKAEGKTASAWAEFKEVVSLARRDGRKDREQVALEAIAELEPKLSHLRIDVTRPAREQNVEVSLDDAPLPGAAYSAPVPVDPGTHKVTARALGRVPFATSIEIAGERDDKTVQIPALTEEPHLVAPVPTPQGNEPPKPRPKFVKPAPESPSPRRTVAYVLGGAGVVSFAVGGIFGLNALQKSDESNAFCGNPCSSEAGLAANEDARTAATLANVFLGAGLVAIAAGAILYITAPSGKAASAKRMLAF
jgi:hypothetical protein